MKTIALLTLAATLAIGAGFLGAGEAPTAPAEPRPAAELKDFATVEQFLGLSDAELDQVQQVLTRIRAMKPEERAALRAEIVKFRQLPEGQRQQLRQGWGWMPSEIQDAWREMMQAASPERHAEIQQKLQAMSPDERLTYRRQLAEEYLRKKAGKK